MTKKKPPSPTKTMPSHATAVATIKYAIVAMYTPRSKFRRKQAAGEGCVSFQIETPPAI